MKMVVGLGNPGREYAASRHNVGWLFLDAYAAHLGCGGAWRLRREFKAEVAEGFFRGEKIILVKPQTYMNLSGEAVGPLLNWYKLPTEDLVVVHDDMDLPVGTVRIRKKGGDGGHNGLKSLLLHLPDGNFSRIRIGIGRPDKNWTVVNHVLAAISENDRAPIEAAVEYLIPAVDMIITDGTDLAMNRYNPKKVKKKPEPKAETAEAQAGADGENQDESENLVENLKSNENQE